MTKQRIGAQVTDIFSSTSQTKNNVDKPSIKTISSINKIDNLDVKSNMVKSTVTLLNDQICWLDRLSSDIRANSMAIVDRGAIIRAVLNALRNSPLNLNDSTSEQEITEIILSKLKK